MQALEERHGALGPICFPHWREQAKRGPEEQSPVLHKEPMHARQ